MLIIFRKTHKKETSPNTSSNNGYKNVLQISILCYSKAFIIGKYLGIRLFHFILFSEQMDQPHSFLVILKCVFDE